MPGEHGRRHKNARYPVYLDDDGAVAPLPLKSMDVSVVEAKAARLKRFAELRWRPDTSLWSSDQEVTDSIVTHLASVCLLTQGGPYAIIYVSFALLFCTPMLVATIKEQERAAIAPLVGEFQLLASHSQ